MRTCAFCNTNQTADGILVDRGKRTMTIPVCLACYDDIVRHPPLRTGDDIRTAARRLRAR